MHPITMSVRRNTQRLYSDIPSIHPHTIQCTHHSPAAIPHYVRIPSIISFNTDQLATLQLSPRYPLLTRSLAIASHCAILLQKVS